MRTWLNLLPLALVLFISGCPAPEELEWTLESGGEDILFVQGPDNEGLPLVEVEYRDQFREITSTPSVACQRECGSIGPVNCVAIAELEPAGVALLPGDSLSLWEGRVWVESTDPAGTCLQQVQSARATRVTVCHSTEALDENGEPLVYEQDESGTLTWEEPIELVDPTCETFEYTAWPFTVELAAETA
jgi:hypothetical protein